MSRVEETLIRRWSGAKIIAASLLSGAAGASPLLLYIVFGPKDGNPIGFGLLAMAGVLLAAIGVAAGLVKMLIEFLLRGR